MLSRMRLASLLLPLVATVSLPGQTSPPAADTTPTFRTTVPAVILDVTVIDTNGQPVSGLTQDDFEILEKGKKQPIASFEEHRGQNRGPAYVPPKKPVTGPTNVFSNQLPTPPPDAVYVLLLDSLNTPYDDQRFVHAAAVKCFKQLPAGAHVAIFLNSTKLFMIQGFTSDPVALFAAMGEKHSNPQWSPVLKTRGDEIADNQTMSQMESLAAGAGSQVMMANIQAMERSIEERDESQTDHRVNITLWNLKQLGHFLAAVPGRKNVIWFSGSFPISVIPTEKNSTQPSADLLPRYYEEEVQKTSEILAAARVAIYPIDARGLRPSNFYDASIPPTNPGSNPSALQSASLYKEDLQRIAENASMDEIAIDTGGKAFYNTNGLEDAMVKVFDTGDHFYTITYTPRNRNMDGQFRKVNVKTNKGGYKLSYRHGYYAVDRDKALELPGNPVGGPLQTFMGLGMPNYDQIPFQMTIEPEAAHVVAAAAAKLSIQKYNVDLTVPSGGLTLALEPDGTHRGALKLGFAAYIRNGECMYRVWRLIDVTIPPESFQDFEQKGLQIHQLIDLPKGELWLRTGIYEPSSSRVGTLEVSMSTIAH